MFVGRVVAASGYPFVLLLGSPGLDCGLDRHPFVPPFGEQRGGRVVQFIDQRREVGRPAEGSDELLPGGGRAKRVRKFTN